MDNDTATLQQLFNTTRERSISLCATLGVEDLNLQATAETSPLKWHLAHTSWFFETFLLKPFYPSYKPLNSHYQQLFNSYYNSVGKQFPRPLRHLLSRPSAEEIYAYRHFIDKHIHSLIQIAEAKTLPDICNRLLLGIHHEQQHQELMLMDLKYNWSFNPLHPTYSEQCLTDIPSPKPLNFTEFDSALWDIGVNPHCDNNATEFSFDNEGPKHKFWLPEFAIANRLITNAEYIDFIEDGGYQESRWWTSDGWLAAQNNKWLAPLYWTKEDNEYFHYTLHGFQPVLPNHPVCHVSLYEALAFANWKQVRLCREQEWEAATTNQPVEGNFQTDTLFHPTGQRRSTNNQNPHDIQQLFGDVWEWTQSSYSPYPGYRADEGAFGEYNGKFMTNQVVLKGGSIATPPNHVRATYRNFFYPGDRWQFSGIRLAHDL